MCHFLRISNIIDKMSMNKRRVVVTGLGLVTPLGLGVKENWLNLLSGKSSTISLESDRTKKSQLFK
jgi:3-oxoacyl-(acyl-carrier-protein) synthase